MTGPSTDRGPEASGNAAAGSGTRTPAGSHPLVSVVLPTYDRAGTVPRAVETVVCQTYDPVELVVVDDCSPTPVNRTLEDVETGSLAALRCLRHETNRGANAARNTGIEAAAGEYIAFLDDDDEWAPEKLARQVSAFERTGEGVGVVYTGTRYVDAETGDDLVVTPTNRGQVTRDILTGGRFGEFSAVMVRATVIEDAGLPDERFPSWQDREWLLRLSRHCEFEPVPEPLTVRRVNHGRQISDDYEAKRDVSYPLFVEKHRSLAAEHGPVVERRFVASLSTTLGRAALRNGHYDDARWFLAAAAVRNPLSPGVYPPLVASLGGPYTHRAARLLVRLVRSLI
jgi:glycosyltransferase involved in cell wall biosynthesis